jgi:alpha-N-arabinofuranosidase
LSDTGQPAFLARRQQHQRFRAAAALHLPDDPEVSAGLAAFQNEAHHYYLGIRAHDGALVAFVERAAGGAAVTVAQHGLPDVSARDTVEVAVVGDRGTLDFLVRAGDGAWLPVADDLDARILSSEVAGGFVGTMLGPHARREYGAQVPGGD